MRKSWKLIKGIKTPYVHTIPEVHRPTEMTLSRPKNQEERLYCWFYWLNLIQDPTHTREVLDILPYLPEFRATWGPDWYKGDEIYDKWVKN